MSELPIFHICPARDWEAAQSLGAHIGTQQDRQDGFIHCSTADQVRESARRHLSGVTGLVLLAIDPVRLGDTLKWERSRGGESFPHIYGALPTDAVIWTAELPVGAHGEHQFPEDLAQSA